MCCCFSRVVLEICFIKWIYFIKLHCEKLSFYSMLQPVLEFLCTQPGSPDYPKRVQGNKNPSWHCRALNVGVREAVEIQNPCWAVLPWRWRSRRLGWPCLFVLAALTKHEACTKLFQQFGDVWEVPKCSFHGALLRFHSSGPAWWNCSKWPLLGARVSWTLAMLLLLKGSSWNDTRQHILILPPCCWSLSWFICREGGVWFLGDAFISAPSFRVQRWGIDEFWWFLSGPLKAKFRPHLLGGWTAG